MCTPPLIGLNGAGDINCMHACMQSANFTLASNYPGEMLPDQTLRRTASPPNKSLMRLRVQAGGVAASYVKRNQVVPI